VTVADHNGLLEVYWLAESATPFAGLQLPSCEIDPTRYTLSPYAVVTSSLNVTATAVAVVHLATIVLALLLTVLDALTFFVEEDVAARGPRAEAETEAARASKGKKKDKRMIMKRARKKETNGLYNRQPPVVGKECRCLGRLEVRETYRLPRKRREVK